MKTKLWDGRGLPAVGETFEVNLYDRSGDNWTVATMKYAASILLFYITEDGEEITQTIKKFVEGGHFRKIESDLPVNPGWIPVSERLPEKYREVPVKLVDGTTFIARIERDGARFVRSSWVGAKYRYPVDVAYWYDVPEFEGEI